MRRCKRFLAWALAWAVLAGVRPVLAADRFYLYDSVLFGLWGNGWWEGSDVCPPSGAERMLCIGPSNTCGAIGLPSVCYAFADMPDSCREAAYPAGEWTVDLHVTGAAPVELTVAIVSAGCDTLCSGIQEHGSSVVTVSAGQCTAASVAVPAEGIVLGPARRVGLRISHQNPEFSSWACWGDPCQTLITAPAGRLCATAVSSSTWGTVKARYR